ncbi:unnamed protein product [Phytophthora fragariaefolia]|uniref:Unnamed protein product n=1 Tax=Phytophthora fragariaefolia TaxID=1490495 RepID=A0A9W7D8W0_9STRA|nr:unnamed protein product [Phytophthora fragariaefolia]
MVIKRDETRTTVLHHRRHDTGLIAVPTLVTPPVSLAAQANVALDPTWAIDSGCTRHVTHGSHWWADIATSGGSITVGGKNKSQSKVLDELSWQSLTPKATRRRSPFMKFYTHPSCTSTSYRSRSSFTPFGGFGGGGLCTPSPFPERHASGRSAAPTYRGSGDILSNEYEHEPDLGSGSDDQQLAGRSSELNLS